ncbi:MAG TPA: zinc ABC transporter substrate-binding protein, partial [Sulfurospirillum sp. UBA11407]
KELQVPVIKVSPLAKNWKEQLLKIAQSIANK